MNKHFSLATLTASLAVALSVAAQAQTPAPATQTPAAAPAGTVTVEGCLVREADVPGRKPNVAERVGVTEDYILTGTKMVKGSAPGAAAARPEDRPVGTAGAPAAMYEVEGVDEDKLKPNLGRRVQIDGTFENVNRTPTGPADELVQIRATMIRPVPGECPPKP
jgi:hypothetical protein